MVVFSIDDDPYCMQAKALLDERGLKYKDIKINTVENGDQMLKALETISGQASFPVVYMN